MNNGKVVEELGALRLPELQARFKEVTGEETRSPNKKYLVKRIAEGLRLSAASKKQKPAEEVAAAADPAPETEAPAETAPPRKSSRKKNPDQAKGDDAGEPKVSKMDVPALQARFKELTGREAHSVNRRYLVWRVQQAMKGRVPVGPRAGRGSGERVDVKVLPMRVPTAAIQPLDEVWRKLGLRSRNEMFRKAMAAFLVNAGESDLAGHLGATFAPGENPDAGSI